MAKSPDDDPEDGEFYEPSEDEIAQMRTSSPEERAAVEALVLRECSDSWQKVAKIIGNLLDDFDRTYEHLPYAYLQATMQKLEDLGKVEIVGDVWSMRYSEIRLAQRMSDAA